GIPAADCPAHGTGAARSPDRPNGPPPVTPARRPGSPAARHIPDGCAVDPGAGASPAAAARPPPPKLGHRHWARPADWPTADVQPAADRPAARPAPQNWSRAAAASGWHG